MDEFRNMDTSTTYQKSSTIKLISKSYDSSKIIRFNALYMYTYYMESVDYDEHYTISLNVSLNHAIRYTVA